MSGNKFRQYRICANIGFVRKDRKFIVKGNEGKEEKEIININIDELKNAWKKPLSQIS